MSWQIVGAMQACAPLHEEHKPAFGPHPRKRWVGPARPRGYRSPRTPGFAKVIAAPLDYNAARGVLYAEWLAARDGVDVTQWNGSAVFTKFRSAITGETIKRVQAVEFREPVHGYSGSSTRGPVLARVEIPHWDFEHPEPVETLAPEIEW